MKQFVLALFLAFPAFCQPPDLDDYIQQAMKTFDVPGVGVAVVKDGAVFAKGYCMRKLGESAAVDSRTLFGIGSISQVKMIPVSPLTDFSYEFQDLLITPKK
jgi:CubicO group peptidase (beta-lactamase class C family)